ncbi:MAG: sigma-70 family RNA polymerase sigma factor [Candidatus Paceibacterota bacterium]|jgi:RNA polymerase sigma-70 factor (ECF subfamily)
MAEETPTNKSVDAELVRTSLESPEEFGRIIEKYQEPLRRYVRRIARASRDETDIILQDIFIKTYENLNDFDQGLAFSSWIYRIAHNESIDYLRRNKRSGTSLDDPAYDDESLSLAETIAADEDMELELDKGYLRKNVGLILDQLDPQYRAVLALRFIDDRSYEEISDILRKPPGTIATLLHRAKKEFRRIAEEQKKL